MGKDFILVEVCERGGKSVISTSTCKKYKHQPPGLQRTANEYAKERRIYKDLISKNEQ